MIETIFFKSSKNPLDRICLVKGATAKKSHTHSEAVRISATSKSNLREHLIAWHESLYEDVITLFSEGATRVVLQERVQEFNNKCEQTASRGSLPKLLDKMRNMSGDVLKARVLFALHGIKYGHSYASCEDFILDAFFNALKKSRSTVLGTRQQMASLTTAICAFTMKSIYDKASSESMTSYSITIDGWKGSKQDSYVGLTVHYVTAQFRLASHAIEVIEVVGSQTAGFLANHIRDRCNFHFPSASLFGITCDGGKNYQNAAMDVVGCQRRLWCVAHVGNLAIHDACDHHAIVEVIANAKAIKSSFSSNQLIFKEFQTDCNAEFCVNGFVDFAETRWCYTTNVLERLRIIWPLLRTYKRKKVLPALDTLITKKALEQVEVLHVSLSIISRFITRVQSQDRITLSKLPEWIQEVLFELSDLEEDEEDESLQEIISAVKTSFKNRFDHVFSAYSPIALSCLLDPTTIDMHPFDPA
jgi:hypothetical protein